MSTLKAPQFGDMQLLQQLGLREAEPPQVQALGSSMLWLLLNECSLLMLIEFVVTEKGLFYSA